jgi:uroporphyrinogen decarboxylase
MLPRERVIEVINHRKPDRIPIYAWLFANMEKQISERFGSVRNFEDIYEFDMAHIFGGPHPYTGEHLIRA